MPFLLDTNAWVRYIRGTSPALQVRFATTPSADIRVCSIVVAELRRGALRSADPVRHLAVVESVLAQYQSYSFDDGAAIEYAKARVVLGRQGNMIGHFDLMIAAVALVEGLTVVTHNVGEFARVPGLAYVDWEIP